MPKAFLTWGTRLVAACSSRAAVADGELESLRTRVHSSPPEDASSERPGRREAYDPHDESVEDFAEELFGGLVLTTVAAPVWVPHRWFDDPDCERFAGYCETDKCSGYKESDWFYDSTDFVSAARAQVEYGTDYSGTQTVGGKLQFDLPVCRTTFDGSWTTYYEDVANAGTDTLSLGDANIVFRFAQNPRMTWRTGVGVNWLADAQSEAGFNFTYGIDVLPTYPFVWSAEIDWGTLGHAELFRSRTTLGAQWREVELYCGFEYVDVDTAHILTMLYGLRYWW